MSETKSSWVDPFDFLYEAREEAKAAFADHWCGPDKFKHGVDTLVARYDKRPDDGDGQMVEVYCCALPAQFYRLYVRPGTDSIGRAKPGYAIGTGSSSHKLAAAIAEAIADWAFHPEGSGAMNPDTTFRPPDNVRYADNLTDRLFDLVRQCQIARDKFDEEQIVEAIKQALESGDFVKYIVAEPGPPPEAWNGLLRAVGAEPSGKYQFTTRSTISYEPGREAARLREKIENAERLVWTEVEDEGGGFWAQTPFFLYSVRPSRCADPYDWVYFLPDEDGHGCATADEAKARCDADWRRRVHAMLGT